MWWTADKVAYRNRDDFVRAYQGSEMIWDKGSGNKIFYTSTSGRIVETSFTGFGGVNIISNTYNNGVGVIEFDGPVTAIAASSFAGMDISSIVIPISVESLGGSSFSLTDLTSLYIPQKVRMIYTDPLFAGTDISSIVVDSNNQRYDSRDNCNAVIRKDDNALILGCKNTVIPSTVEIIFPWAFAYCEGLTSIDIPSSVTSIGGYAFAYCTELTNVNRPSGQVSNGNLYIPDSVTEIDYYAFYGCKKLKYLNLPSSVTRIGTRAFCESGLYWIEVDQNNQVYDSRGYCNCLIETSTNKLIQGSATGTIPSTVTSIVGSAFSGTDKQYLTIPSSVTSIGDYLCSNCTELVYIVVNSNNQVYDSRDNCNAIIETSTNKLIQGCKNSNIPSTVVEIGTGAFYGCTGLTSITIPSSVTSIGKQAFYGCTGLTSITIPSSVTSIYNRVDDYSENVSAFSGCGGFTSIVVDQNNQVYDSRDNCNAIIKTDTNCLEVGCRNTVIPSTVTKIGDGAFAYCEGLNSFVIPSTVTEIGTAAFERSDLSSITIPSSITEISIEAFRETNLTSITIPSSVTSIGSGAFLRCHNLTSVTIPSSVTVIYDQAFEDCENLYEVIVNCTIPPSFGSFISGLPFTNNRGDRVFKVPEASLQAYKTAPGWSNYASSIVAQ